MIDDLCSDDERFWSNICGNNSDKEELAIYFRALWGGLINAENDIIRAKQMQDRIFFETSVAIFQSKKVLLSTVGAAILPSLKGKVVEIWKILQESRAYENDAIGAIVDTLDELDWSSDRATANDRKMRWLETSEIICEEIVEALTESQPASPTQFSIVRSRIDSRIASRQEST